jgi:hypothetical protein
MANKGINGYSTPKGKIIKFWLFYGADALGYTLV